MQCCLAGYICDHLLAQAWFFDIVVVMNAVFRAGALPFDADSTTTYTTDDGGVVIPLLVFERRLGDLWRNETSIYRASQYCSHASKLSKERIM